MDAQKEKARKQKRRHLSEAEDLRAFAFEDEEYAPRRSYLNSALSAPLLSFKLSLFQLIAQCCIFEMYGSKSWPHYVRWTIHIAHARGECT